ncbi:MAG: hypothetical protein KJZ87_00890 [Thermoguttaceae bacterium]|nr:hypothetical protein [Thermoguttaceae bacterium]
MMRCSRKTIGLLLLASLALALRLLTVLLVAAPIDGPVAYEHGEIARNLLAGKGFTIEFLGTEGPTSQQAPLYPFFLAAVYACFGVDSPASVMVVQILQCAAGAGLVLAVVWLAWSLLPEQPAAGWLAGLGAAVYPTHIYMATHLQVAPWAALLLTLSLAVSVSPRWKGTWRGAVLAGALGGLLLLAEPILALALPVCALAFCGAELCSVRSSAIRTRWRGAGLAAAMALAAAAVIAPWIVRNWLVHGELVFVKSTFGYAFWQANNEISWGTDKVPKASAEMLRRDHDGTLAGMNRALWNARHETLYIDDVLLRPGGYREFRGLTEPERSRVLGRRAAAFIAANPGRYAALCLNRLRYFLIFDQTNPKAANRLYRAGTSAWLVLCGVGLLATIGQWRRLWPTYAIFATVTLFHTLVITSVRFRIPIEPLSFLWGAAALAPLISRRAIHSAATAPAEADAAHPAGPRLCDRDASLPVTLPMSGSVRAGEPPQSSRRAA